MRFSFIILLFSTALFAEDPWGRDADLIPCRQPKLQLEEPSVLKKLGALLISFHQEVISPIDGPRSHFFPSSSQYTKEAILKHGFFLGVALGCDRLMRENDDPWVYQSCTAPDGRTLKLNLIP